MSKSNGYIRKITIFDDYEIDCIMDVIYSKEEIREMIETELTGVYGSWEEAIKDVIMARIYSEPKETVIYIFTKHTDRARYFGLNSPDTFRFKAGYSKKKILSEGPFTDLDKKSDVSSFEIEEYLEQQGEQELKQAFKAMVGCDGEQLFNSLNPDVFKYNEKENPYYQYRVLLIKEKEKVISIANTFSVDYKPLYYSFKDNSLYNKLLDIQDSAKLLGSMQNNDTFGLYLNFQASLSPNSEAIFIIRLIIYTLRKIDLSIPGTIKSIENIHKHIVNTHKEPKTQMLSNYFSVISEEYSKEEKDEYNKELGFALGSAFAYLERERYDVKHCLDFFNLEGMTSHLAERDSRGYIEHIDIDLEVCRDEKVSTENIIKRTCKELGITQKELAKLVGVNDGTIRKWSSQSEPPEWGVAFLDTLIENKHLKIKLYKFNQAFKLIEEARDS